MLPRTHVITWLITSGGEEEEEEEAEAEAGHQAAHHWIVPGPEVFLEKVLFVVHCKRGALHLV
ncbi:hypothetical protein Ct61P_15222 [Colletotrichum tofieldiae]|nr:hypothetical protein Ct61P_15222 [Colletotrichum tofieldiae]